MSALLVEFPRNAPLAGSIESCWPCRRTPIEWHRFPDGESLLRLDASCYGRDVVLLASLDDPDRLALPIRFVARTAKEYGARSVGLVAPYLGYMRQDARFRPGEAVSSAHFADFLSETVDWLVTVDAHLHRIPSLADLFRIPVRAVSAMPAIATWVSTHLDHPALVGPDAESAQWVERVARLAGAPCVVLQKTRRGDADVAVSLPDRDALVGHDLVLVDDIVSTGRTMIETIGRLRELGLPAPTCVATHGIFANGADGALLAAGAARVVTTNTLPHSTNAIDVGPAICEALRDLVGRRAEALA